MEKHRKSEGEERSQNEGGTTCTTFTSTGNEDLIYSTEARVYGVMTLCQSLKLSKEYLVFQIPQMNTLISDVDQR